MITYWPNKRSIELNLAVSNLFANTHQKFSFKFFNKTKSHLPTDIFEECTKKQLLLEILIQFETLVIDIVELNLSLKELKQASNQILLHLISITARNLIYKLKIQPINFFINFHLNYNKLFFYEHSLTSHVLLAYLIFGTEGITRQLFPFDNQKTPVYHIKALFENSIIQIANIIAFNLLENSNSIKKVYSLICDKNLMHYSYQSIRKLSNFKNNLNSYNLINFYIDYPQNIYCGKYKIWLLSSKGIIFKYVYLNRFYNYLKLSNYQLISIIYLEMQDFIIPRINFFIALIGKLVIYVFVEIISKNFSTNIKYIVKKFNTKKH